LSGLGLAFAVVAIVYEFGVSAILAINYCQLQ